MDIASGLDPFANGANPFDDPPAPGAIGGTAPDAVDRPLTVTRAPRSVVPPMVASPPSPSSSGSDPFAGGRNPFDDDAPAAAARSPAAPPPASAAFSAAPDPFAGGRNPFDDDPVGARPPAAPASSTGPGPLANDPGSDSFLTGMAKNAATTAIKGVSHAPGFVGDIAGFADALMEVPEYVESKITGQPFSDVVAKRKALGEQTRARLQADQRSVLSFAIPDPTSLPSGSQIAAPVLARTGEYQPTTPLGRYGSAAGEAALGAFGPGGGSMLGGVLQHALPNAAAGIASQAAADATGGDPLAASLAGLGVTAIPGAAGAAYGRMIQGRAARTSAAGSSDPTAALAAIDAARSDSNAIPGYQPTTAQVTQDPGIAGMQSVAAGTDARGPQFDARRQQQGRALGSALDGLSIENAGDPGKVATAFQQHFDDIGERTQAMLDGHLTAAQGYADALRGSGLPTDAAGQVMRSALVDAHRAKTQAEGVLHEAVDPAGTLTGDASGVKAAAAQVYGNMTTADRAFMAPEEQTFANLIGGLGDVSSYRELAALKSNMAEAQRDARDSGQGQTYRRLSALMSPLQDTINGTVARRAAADNAAVAAGTMAPEDTLGAFLQQKAAATDPRRNAGADVSARAVGIGAGSPSAADPALGAGQRQQGRVPGAASPAGIPRDEPAGAAPAGPPASGAIRPLYYPGGATRVRNELVEHGSLVTSHDGDFRPRPDYPANLQPRDRGSVGARDQVNGMAARLQPERLGPSPEASGGAPIVGPDDVVESGNGRTMAIGKAYDAGAAGPYRAHLESLGYDTSGFDRPVLVGRRVAPMTPNEREFFTHAANDATALRMGSAEQAAADANKITPGMLDSLAGPDMAAAGNRPFATSFMAKLPASERGALVDRSGALSQAGVRRLQGAMVAHAYGDNGLLARAFDDADPGVKGMVGALTDAAGPWAKMRNAINDGTISADHDVTPELMQGVKLAMRARDEGRPIGELLAQRDMFSPDTSRLVTGMLTRDGTRVALRAQIEANLRAYAEEAVKNSAGDRLFGGAASVNDVLRAAGERAARETGSQPSKLPDAPTFADVPPPPRATFDEAAGARKQAADAATRDRVATFGAKPIADVLAERGGRGNFRLPNAAVPGKLFPKGPAGYEAVQAFRKAVGDDATSMRVLRDHDPARAAKTLLADLSSLQAAMAHRDATEAGLPASAYKPDGVR